MKAQSYFGGTNPKSKATKVRQVGSSSATPGVNSIDNNAGSYPNMNKGRKQMPIPSGSGNIDPRYKVKQVGTITAGDPTNNSQNFRDGSYSSFNINKRLKRNGN